MIYNESPTLLKYKDIMGQFLNMYFPGLSSIEINNILDYSISKRLTDTNVNITNSYKRRRSYKIEDNKIITDFVDPKQEITLHKLTDYILSKQPIVTAYGTMFKHHGTEPNPLVDVVDSFLADRSIHKNLMFSYPKGSTDYEKYNLLQALDKIDANGIYGAIGMFTCFLYNNNVASSVTNQGRALDSSMVLHFEAILANNVKFGSLNEVLEFIYNICSERDKRVFNDFEVLNHIPSVEECFAKVVLSCGFRWVPNEEELEVIWRVLNNLSPHDITRIYYKNNLYEFCNNTKVIELIKTIMRDLRTPLYNAKEVPPEIADNLNLFKDLIMDYVYYRFLYIDRIDRADNMIRSVAMLFDTDSTIISLDAWYRFVLQFINNSELNILDYSQTPKSIIDFVDYENRYDSPIEFTPKILDYNFNTDEIEEINHFYEPEVVTENDNVRYSIINIMLYVLDHTVNDYMVHCCRNNNSVHDDYHKESECKIFAKSEFLFKRVLLTQVKKNYASIIEMQEGNIVPKEEQLDIKGIEALMKSTKPLSTRNALKKILLEDILSAPKIDQLRIIKDIAIFEKQIMNSIKSGSKEYFKPVTIKSMSSYVDPTRIQGIKASIAWNHIRTQELPAINLDERNAINIAKVNINRATIEDIRDKYPNIYNNMSKALDEELFKTYIKNSKTGEKKLSSNSIDTIAIPQDVLLPEWLEIFLDYDSIIADNLNGFPYESVGIKRLRKDYVNATNIVEL